VFWTYHVNMRLDRRHISRDEILAAVDSYQLVEEYPDDKYLPSYLVKPLRCSMFCSRRTLQITMFGL